MTQKVSIEGRLRVESPELQRVLREVTSALNVLAGRVFVGAGSPNSVIKADIGSVYLRTDGGASSTLYIKTGDAGLASGWTAYGAGGGVGAGPVTTSGLTMSTARLLGRTTASTGAIEEISVGTGLSLSAGVLTNTVTAGTVADGSVLISSTGTGDDTSVVAAAFATSATVIRFKAGDTFTINTEITSSVADRTIDARGATIKLKNSASSYRPLTLSGSRQTVLGGTWDGNRANQSAGDAFSSWAIQVGSGANDCKIIGEEIKEFRGTGIKLYNCNRALVENCRFTAIGVSGTNGTCYGVYGETNASVNSGHKVLNCFFDFQSSGTAAQPVLLTSADNPYTGASTTNTQRDWEISGNLVLGSTSASNVDQAICLCVRGRKGLVTRNVVIGGSMGWSEGGPDTIIKDNTFRDQTGSLRWGIEYSGARMVIANNWISAGGRGIENSFGIHGSTDDVIIEGNYVEVDPTYSSGTLGGPRCITLQIPSTGTGRNTVIRNNVLRGKTGIVTTYDGKGLTVQGNRFIGPGSGGGTYAISCEGAPAQLFFDIQNNVISAFQYVVGLYSGSAVTYTDAYFAGNNLADDVADSPANYIRATGSAVLGSRLVVAHNREKSTTFNFSWYMDRATYRGIFMSDAYASPNSNVTASPGSIYLYTGGGAGATLYVKESGASTNTGWVAK